MIWLMVVSAAIATGWLYAKYIKAVSRDQAGKASFADFGIMLMGSITTQAWYSQHANFYLLLLFDVVAALATYATVKWSK